MAITRRGLLGSAGMVAALATMPSALVAGEKHLTSMAGEAAKPTTISKETFASLRGSTFEFMARTPQYVTLLSVEDFPAPMEPNLTQFAVPPKSTAPPREITAFAVKFRGGSQRMTQGTYTVKNATLGEFQMFIVPAQDGQLLYTAVFAYI